MNEQVFNLKFVAEVEKFLVLYNYKLKGFFLSVLLELVDIVHGGGFTKKRTTAPTAYAT